MTPENQKKFNVTAGGTFGFLGLMFVLMTFYVAAVPAPPKPAPTLAVPMVSPASCRDMLTQLGYVSSLTSGGGVSAKDASLTDPEGALTKATAAIAMCKMSLNEFCMGSACPDPGISFKLVPEKQFAEYLRKMTPAPVAASAASAAKPKKK